MESKKINQLATNVSPQTSDLTIIGDPTTGVSKKITLLQIANLFATTGTVTSVGVTETGDALTITGSPITTAGTINIGFAGAATQYVRGDGALADFPTSTGGGSSVSYYLNSSVSQGTIGGVAYRQLSKTPIAGAGTDITISANGYVASFITDSNDPALLEVPAGNFNCEFYFSVNSNAHNPNVYAELYKYDGTTFTLLGSNQSIPEYLKNGSTLSAYYFAMPIAVASLTITDRLAIRIYVNVDTRIVTLHTENSHLCQVVTTFSKGLTTLNSLTRQTQFFATGTSGTDFAISSTLATHTFNLPVASATNTGKLSSTDWSTFNGKVPYTGATQSVDLGINDLSSRYLFANGNASASGILAMKISTTVTATSGYGTIGALSGQQFAFVSYLASNYNKIAYFNLSGLSDSTVRTFTLPDATGTLALTSDLGSYLPLTGGTLTGALSGTSATFSGQFSIGTTAPAWSAFTNMLNLQGGSIGGTSTTDFRIFQNMYYDGGSYRTRNTGESQRWDMGSGALYIYTAASAAANAVVTPTLKFNITNTGAATFSSSVTADSLVSNGGGQINTTVSPFVFFNSGGGGNAKKFGLNMTNLDGFKIYSLNDNGTTRKDNIIFANIDGNVGIGTNTPRTAASGANRTLDIKGGIYFGDTNSESCTINNNDSMIFNIDADNSSTSNFFRFATNTTLETGGTELMRITEGGAINIVDSYFLANSGFGYRFNNQANTFNNVIMYDNGNVSIRGALSKGSGSFRIDHPLESMNKTHQLVHSFIEGPKADLIYRGKLTLINGKAQANIDEASTMTVGTFEVLCREIQCFTTNESGWDLVKGKVIGNIIYIESQNENSTDEISWMVIGERKDKHMMDTDWTDENGKVIVEPLKSIQELNERLDKIENK